MINLNPEVSANPVLSYTNRNFLAENQKIAARIPGAFQNQMQAISFRYNDRVNGFCAPIFDYFGLSRFYYVKISDKGYLTSIDSHVPFSEYWASEEAFRYPFHRHPKFFRDEASVITHSKDELLNGMISNRKRLFNFNSWLRIVAKVGDGVEEFGFSSPFASPVLSSALIREAPLFHLFLKKFKGENQIIFSKLEELKIDIARIVGADFYKNDLPEISDAANRRNLLKSLGVENEEALKPREIRALKLIIEGYSAGKIAEKTFVSKRTVEHLIERLKEKLCCYSKVELIQKARALEHLSLLG